MIRFAKVADIPRLMELLAQTAQLHHDIRPDIFKAGVTKYTSEQLQAILREKNTPVFVAVSDSGEVEGYAFCRVTAHKGEQLLEDFTSVYIDDLCVEEHCRGKSLGTQIYAYVKEYAKAIGADSITLNVWEGNSALAFYKKLGLGMQRYYMEEIL